MLESNSFRDRHDKDGPKNPLWAAVQVGNLDMCRALINIGNMNPFDALSRDSEGQLALKDEILQSRENKEQILNFLSTHAMTN
jgi:hypothetical protein